MRVNALLDAIPILEPNLKHSDDQHERIIAATLLGDQVEARLAMKEHLTAMPALLRGFLG